MTAAIVDACINDLSDFHLSQIEKVLRYDWRGEDETRGWAREKQKEPEGEWDVLGFVAGRGGGKTRPGAEITRQRAERFPGIRIALVGRTAQDVRDTMVLGESGVIACSPPWFRPTYKPSLRLVLWPNGSQAHMYSADKADQLRGPQHHFAWGDEFAAWTKKEVWTNLQDGLRLGKRPQIVLTTTPRRTELVADTFLGPRPPNDRETGRPRPRPVSKEAMQTNSWEFTATVSDHDGMPVTHRTVVRRWKTEENSTNLSPGFAAKRRAKYGQSALGRQELDAEILEKVDGALWQQETFDNARYVGTPKLKRVEIAVDPTRADDPVDECGIVAGGVDEAGICYILGDYTITGPPNTWIKAALSAYNEHKADAIVYEGNRLGEDIRNAIRTASPGVKWVEVTASTDKAARAAPVSALYEQGKVRHKWTQAEHDKGENPLEILEEECCVWVPLEGKSPNRLDALVWLVTSLMVGVRPTIAAPRSVGVKKSDWVGRG